MPAWGEGAFMETPIYPIFPRTRTGDVPNPKWRLTFGWNPKPRLKEGIAQTLAGRTPLLMLLTFSIEELASAGIRLACDELPRGGGQSEFSSPWSGGGGGFVGGIGRVGRIGRGGRGRVGRGGGGGEGGRQRGGRGGVVARKAHPPWSGRGMGDVGGGLEAPALRWRGVTCGCFLRFG